MKKILLVSGKAGAGKDMVADLIVKQFPNWEKMGFADDLKDEVSKLYGLDRKLFDTQEGKKSTNRYGFTNRDMLVHHGMKMRKLDEKYWVNKIKNKIQRSPNNVVISDFRFPNEFSELLSSKNASYVKTLRVNRPTIYLARVNSSTERMLDNFPFNYYIDNDVNGTENLMKQLSKLSYLFPS